MKTKKLLVKFKDSSYIGLHLKEIPEEPVCLNALEENGSLYLISETNNPHLKWIADDDLDRYLHVYKSGDTDVTIIMEK